MDEQSYPEFDKTRIQQQMDSEIVDVRSMEGGLIGNAYRVLLTGGESVVVKTSDYSLWIEYLMLDYLRRKTPLPVPKVIDVSEEFMMMEFIRGSEVGTTAVEREVAKYLAQLHQVTGDAFGFTCDTLAGNFLQPNPWMDSWVEFFRSQRLLYAANKARSQEWFVPELYERIERLSSDLNELLPRSPTPSLIHGDLHEYNIISDENGVKAFIDPAIYYAPPEIELAYVSFESSYGDEFFDAYFTHSSTDPAEFRRQLPIYNTYFTLVRSIVLADRDYTDSLVENLEQLGY